MIHTWFSSTCGSRSGGKLRDLFDRMRCISSRSSSSETSRNVFFVRIDETDEVVIFEPNRSFDPHSL